MPNIWTAVDANFPTISEEESPEQQIQKLLNYMYVLQEQLKYTLNNLDTTNWNGVALTKYSEETTAQVTQQQALTNEELNGKISEIEKAIERIDRRIESIISTVERLEEAVKRLEEEIDPTPEPLPPEGETTS